LFTLMLRDGTIYYGVLAMLYIADIVTFLIAPPPAKGITVTFTNVILSTAMNRLMLNIREDQVKECPSTYGRMPSILLTRGPSRDSVEMEIEAK